MTTKKRKTKITEKDSVSTEDRTGSEYKCELNLVDREDLNRVINFITKHFEIMEILNEDSERAIKGGGAAMYYKVKIAFEEVWV